MPKTVVYLKKSDRDGKKYMVTILQANGRKKTIHFGAEGMSDYTKHKDKDRMKLYEARHKSRENWTKSGINTAGFWSKWILWNKPGLTESIKATEKKFNIDIKRGSAPKKSIEKSRSRRRVSRSRSRRRVSRRKSRR